MSIIEASHLKKSINGNLIVDDISISIPHGRRTGIAGETGSGKTTLLKMMAGLVQPDKGTVLLDGLKVKGPEEQLMEGHPKIAYMSQHFELRNNYRVGEILEYANKLDGAEAEKLYGICRISHLLSRRTNELSGGERQRIALARLLSTSPRLLLLDEPFSNLDAIHRAIIRSVVFDISERLDITCVMVSHDAPDLLSWSDHILLMKGGKVIQEGTPEDVYHHPLNAYAAGLLGDYNLLETDWVRVHLPSWSADGPWMVRPENVKVSAEDPHGLPGTVVRSLFHGSHYDVDVQVGEKVVRAKLMGEAFAVGKRVFITLSRAM
jgi:ABC-type Fe3+/spermidine/putrescine transport system ATPase subunit